MGIKAKSFSVQDCDHYLDHLASLGKQGIAVTAAEDILSRYDSVLLACYGTLGQPEATALHGRRLPRPIDTLFEVPHRLTSTSLLACVHDLLEEAPDLAAVDSHYGFSERLRHICHTATLPVALLQKLTVMHKVLPQVFARTLFTAWFGSLVALEKKLDDDEIRLCFKAGLCHDLGLLHINPTLVDKKSDIEVEEWKEIQSHVGKSAKIASSLRLDKQRLLSAILQHHERCDGAGYPDGIAGEELDPVGQIIALADMVYALRFQARGKKNRTLVDCLPFLRVNLRTFGEENCEAAVRAILAGQRHCAQERLTPRGFTLEELISVNSALKDLLQQSREVRPLLAALPCDRIGSSLISLIEQIQWVSLSSGIGNEAMEGLLRQSVGDPEAAGALDEIYQTATEMFWLVHRVDRQLRALLDASEDQVMPEPVARLAHSIAHSLAEGRRMFLDAS